MPVTARLSRLFYDRFGDQIVRELVDWFNQMDATCRSELRELNEANFARFDARLEQRIAELRAEVSVAIAQLRTEIHEQLQSIRVEMERRFTDQSRWMIGMWMTMIATNLAIGVALWFRR